MRNARTIVLVLVLMLALIAMGSVWAKGNPNGMPDQSWYGLCKAYFSGQGGENGKKNDAPPFQQLIAEAGGEDGVEDFCASQTPGNK